MNRYIENVSSFMNEIEWKHVVNQNGLMVHFGFQMAEMNTQGLFVYHPEQEELVCKVLLPQCSPDHMRRDVSELMTRYNELLYAGNFSMDWESGLILFSVYLLTNDNAWVNQSQIHNMLHLTVSEIMRCCSLFERVIDESQSPEEALDAWFGQQKEENLKKTNYELCEGLRKYHNGSQSLLDQISKN